MRHHHELQLARELEECKRQRHGGLWWWEEGTTAAAAARALEVRPGPESTGRSQSNMRYVSVSGSTASRLLHGRAA